MGISVFLFLICILIDLFQVIHYHEKVSKQYEGIVMQVMSCQCSIVAFLKYLADVCTEVRSSCSPS
jgi:tellurite resistance protein TehA-like permease